MSRRKLTEDQIDRMCELREAGYSFGWIARAIVREFGIAVSEGSISWYCLVRGADLPAERRHSGTVNFNFEPRMRGGHLVRPFTPEEDTLLRTLDMQGFPTSVMAKRLGRRHNSIRGRLATLARQDARAEEAAQ